jgi:hypothetical protein
MGEGDAILTCILSVLRVNVNLIYCVKRIVSMHFKNACKNYVF